ncbi:NEP1-interacting protein 1 [Biomphalaria pfeifferi]|uniref:NEP1-interacting protein 1 n=1 Tax=Biomphalaria pfeifferi TaxID=112525 RepID=A0AAD8BF58_BIOPF|nr:NEP1-interacting protein 1 [Biomphalaria pfeifferi]
MDRDANPLRELGREMAERVREIAERGREMAERVREIVERGREMAERGRERAERCREMAERVREMAKRGRERAERCRERALQVLEPDIEEAVLVIRDDVGSLTQRLSSRSTTPRPLGLTKSELDVLPTAVHNRDRPSDGEAGSSDAQSVWRISRLVTRSVYCHVFTISTQNVQRNGSG